MFSALFSHVRYEMMAKDQIAISLCAILPRVLNLYAQFCSGGNILCQTRSDMERTKSASLLSFLCAGDQEAMNVYLVKEVPCLIWGQSASRDYVIEQLTARYILHDHEDV